MPSRVKVKLELKNLPKQIRREWSLRSVNSLNKSIKDRISTGHSPVSSKGRFQVYSRSYKEAIRRRLSKKFGKRIRPVNMTLTGKMMRSLKIRRIKKGLSVIFTDPKARFHDVEGAGRSKVIRRLLPTRPGERFARPIQKIINQNAKKARSKAVLKQNS